MAGRHVAGDHHRLVDEAAMRSRDTRQRRCGEGRGDSRHHRWWDRAAAAAPALFKAAPEDEGVAALEPHHEPSSREAWSTSRALMASREPSTARPGS